MDRSDRQDPFRVGGSYHCGVCGTRHQVGFCPTNAEVRHGAKDADLD
jgi:hypothetical protein